MEITLKVSPTHLISRSILLKAVAATAIIQNNGYTLLGANGNTTKCFTSFLSIRYESRTSRVAVTYFLQVF